MPSQRRRRGTSCVRCRQTAQLNHPPTPMANHREVRPRRGGQTHALVVRRLADETQPRKVITRAGNPVSRLQGAAGADRIMATEPANAKSPVESRQPTCSGSVRWLPNHSKVKTAVRSLARPRTSSLRAGLWMMETHDRVKTRTTRYVDGRPLRTIKAACGCFLATVAQENSSCRNWAVSAIRKR